MLSKIFFIFLIFSLLIFSLPTITHGFAGVDDPLGGKFGSLGDIITALIPFIYTIAAMIALLFLIWGGIRYMTARGDPKAIDSARSTITSAIIGVLIVLFVGVIFFVVGAVFKIDIFGSIVPAAYAAQVDIGCAVKLAGDQCISAAFKNVGQLFTAIIMGALFLAGLIFLAMMIWGGFRYLNAGGDPKNADAARQTLTNAGIGLLIIMVSFVIIKIITQLAGVASIF